jgi:hypothetical protein
MNEQPFSLRFGYEKRRQLKEGELTAQVRNKLAHIFEEIYSICSHNEHWLGITNSMLEALGEPPCRIHPFVRDIYHKAYSLCKYWQSRLEKDNWVTIFNVFEALFVAIKREIAKDPVYQPTDLITAFQIVQPKNNKIFSDEMVPWIMNNGRFERIIEQGEVIKKAEGVLHCPEFQVAHAHYKKAWEAFHKRPNPDIDGCMDNAWDAVESVATYVAGEKSSTFGNALHILVKEGFIVGDWRPFMEKFYAIANKWVRHKKEEVLPCTIDDTELFLVTASQIVIYLVNQFRKRTKQP